MNRPERIGVRDARRLGRHKKRGAPSEFIATQRYFLVNYPRRTIAVFFASFTLVGLELLGAALIMPILSLVVGGQGDNRLVGIVRAAFESVGIPFTFEAAFLLFIAAFIAKAIMEFLFGIFVDYSKLLIERDFRAKIIEALQSVSWAYFTRKPSGLLVNLMTQEITAATSLFGMSMQVTVSFLLTCVYLVLGLAVSLEMLMAAVAVGVVAIVIARPMFDMARRAGAGQIEHMRDLASDLAQGLQAFKSFKAMRRERGLLATLSTANDSYVDANYLKVRAQQLLHASQQIVLALGVLAGFYVGRDVFGVGLAEVGFIALVLMRTNGHLATLLKKFQAISNMYYALEKFDELHAEIVENAETNPGRKEPSFPSVIRFENISFEYGRRSILRGVDLTIEPCRLTTIMGPSGSGKTTIIDLLCGFYAPTEGRILIGDDDLKTINLYEWRRAIGYLTQEPNLLHQSIARNVAAFDPTIDEDDIVSALKAAGAWPFVARLDHGIHSGAGERGAQLSGGERQRIAIARALARHPKLLVLDEPTAAIDAETEQALVETICRLKSEIPIVAISHQAALADAADVLYRIENSQVVRVR